jgi:hypothetical protein
MTRSRPSALRTKETPEIWMEIRFDKKSEHFTHTRCNCNTPGKWHRFPEPIRNYQIAKRKAFEYLMRRTLGVEACGIEVFSVKKFAAIATGGATSR